MSTEYLSGVGCDVGTSYIAKARQRADGKLEFISERDAFYMMTPKTTQQAKLLERALMERNAFTLKVDDRFYVVGSEAISIANEREEDVSRPLRKGVLLASEVDCFGMLAVLLEGLVGKALFPNEVCVYTYPDNPIDESYDVLFHRRRLDEIFTGLGYNARGILEAEALMYSELAPDLTGIVISAGAGMHNLLLSSLGEIILSFSIAKGGDWIDSGVSRTFSLTESTIQSEKESGIDLLFNYDKSTMEGRIRKSIQDYYEEIILYVLNILELKLQKTRIPKFKKGIPIVISGGTALAKNYLEKFTALAATKNFPFEISGIRLADDPLNAVARGCLISAQLGE